MTNTELDNFVTVKTSDSSTEIKQNLSIFGSEVLITKFPNAYDGLKDVQRRIVWHSKNYTELKGMNAFVGEVSNYHTGGDSSIVGATVRLAQDFMVGHPLIYIDGKSGEYYDPSSAAAPRYLEVAISDFSRDVYFTAVNLKTIPMKTSDTFKGIEPNYLIPRLPMGLILGNLTVGFGFKSYVPMIDFTQVCDLVMLYANYYKNKGIGIPDKKSLAKNLIPGFPIRNLILNREELYHAYLQGNYECPIKLEGWAEVAGNSITLRAIPYGLDFATVTNSLREQLRDRKSKLYDYIDSANQYSADEADFNISIKRGKNPFEVLDHLRGLLRFNTNWKPLYNYTKEGKVFTLTPDKLIWSWYDERYLSIASGLKYRLADCINSKLLYTAILVVIENIDEVIHIIRTSENETEAIDRLSKAWPELTLKQAKQLYIQPLSTLTKSNRSTIERKLEQIDVDIKNTADAFGKIHDIIYHDAEVLKKKYNSTSLTRYSDEFVGYVRFGNWGVIHFFDDNDLYQILNSKGWPSTLKKSIHYYDSRFPLKYYVKDNRVKPLTELSKEIWCDDIICYPANNNDELTLVIGKDGGTSVMNSSVISNAEGYTLCPITKNFYAIHRNGAVTEENYESFSIRKSISKGAKTDLIYGLPNKSKDLVVFHMNTKDPNILRVSRILTEKNLGKLKTVPNGEMFILGIYPLKTKEIMLNIPDRCRKASAMEFLRIRNLKQLFEGRDNDLVLNISKTSKEFKFVRNKEVRTLYSLTF